MLKRAFSTGNHQGAGGGGRWKIRICYVFAVLIVVTLGLLLIAWNMLCGLSPKPLVQVTETPLILNQSSKPKNANADGVEESDRHSIEIFYEVLCPDSRYFITNDFIPAYTLFKDYIKPTFVPYGKASTTTKDGRLSFDCQHGETECLGNMIHACAVAHVKDEVQLVNYIGCMVANNRYPQDIGRKCADKVSVDWDQIHACAKGQEGPELLKSYGDITHSLQPPVSFIPTIVIDGSQKGQKDILKNFKSFLCRKILSKEQRTGC